MLMMIMIMMLQPLLPWSHPSPVQLRLARSMEIYVCE